MQLVKENESYVVNAIGVKQIRVVTAGMYLAFMNLMLSSLQTQQMMRVRMLQKLLSQAMVTLQVSRSRLLKRSMRPMQLRCPTVVRTKARQDRARSTGPISMVATPAILMVTR